MRTPACFAPARSSAWPSTILRLTRSSSCTLPRRAVRNATWRGLRAAVVGQVLSEPGVPGAFDVGDGVGLGIFGRVLRHQADDAQVGALHVRVGKRVVA